MKLVRASQAKGPANRKEAWACLTANLALPGSGSLAAGKPVGYYQLGLAAIGCILTMITGIHLLMWIMNNQGRLNDSTGDPFENLVTLWLQIRWPLASLALFAFSLLWAMITSLGILSAHPKNPVPPRIVN